jgi:Uma2 family endonuclease
MDGDRVSLLARYPTVPRHLLTVDDYHRMGEAGILSEDDRVELIEGELVEMEPIGSEHAAAVNDLTRLLIMAWVTGRLSRRKTPSAWTGAANHNPTSPCSGRVRMATGLHSPLHRTRY